MERPPAAESHEAANTDLEDPAHRTVDSQTASTSSIAVSRSTHKVHRRINQAGQIPTVITRLPRVMSDIAAAAGAARIRVFICMLPLDATCVGGSKRSATQGLCTWSTLVACDRAEIRPPARIGAGPYLAYSNDSSGAPAPAGFAIDSVRRTSEPVQVAPDFTVSE